VDTIVHTDTDTGANVMLKLKRQEARDATVNVTLKLNKKLKRQEERETLKAKKSRQPRKMRTQAKKSQKIKQRDGTVMDMVDTV